MKNEKLNVLHDIYQNYITNQEKFTLDQLKDIAVKCEAVHREYAKKWLSPNHNLEIYLFEFYICKEDYNCTEYTLHEIYRRLGEKHLEANNRIDALQAFDDSLRWNPLDLDTRFEKAKVYRSMQELEKYKRFVEESYPFCYTKNDLARYYRYLGYYYLETYQPDLAEALYTHSNVYYQSKMADQEIMFLQKALGNNKKDQGLDEMRELIKKAGIPLFPNEDTLKLLLEVAKTELDSGNKGYAKYLFLFYYQLTGDKDTESILKYL